MTGSLVLLAAAVIPCLALLWFFSGRDLYPEPPRRIWAAFWAGIAAMLLALCAALPLQAFLPGPEVLGPYRYGLMDAFLLAAIPEECAKFLVLLRFCRKTPDCDEPMDCLVYAAAASLGFAALENILYVQDGGMTLALLRAVSAVPSHALYGAIMGYFLGRALFTRPGFPGMYALALLVPIGFHGIYDAGPLILSASEAAGVELPDEEGLPLALLALATLITQALVASVMLRRLREEQRRANLAITAPGLRIAEPAQPKRLAYAALAGGALLGAGSLVVLALAILGTMAEPVDSGALSELALGLSILIGPPLIAAAALLRYARKRFREAGRETPRLFSDKPGP